MALLLRPSLRVRATNSLPCLHIPGALSHANKTWSCLHNHDSQRQVPGWEASLEKQVRNALEDRAVIMAAGLGTGGKNVARMRMGLVLHEAKREALAEVGELCGAAAVHCQLKGPCWGCLCEAC